MRYRRIARCPECKGSGARPGTQPRPCASCGGSGEKTSTRRPEPRGPAGDLLVVVRAAPDPRFERHGADLWRLQEIAAADAVLGTELTMPTLDGAIAVKVPPGTQPDSQLRLRGKGLPRFGARGRGDLYVRLAVKLPERRGAQPLAEAARAADQSILTARCLSFPSLGSLSSSGSSQRV